VEDWGDGNGTDNGASAFVEASKRGLVRPGSYASER